MVAAVHVVGVVFLCTGAVSLSFVWVALRYWETPGARGFAFVAAGTSLWTLALGASKFTGDLVLSVAAYNLVLFAAQVVSIGWFLLAVEFTDWRPLSKRVLAPLVAFVLVEQALVWTNPLHHVVLGPGTTVQTTVLAPVYGPGFWAHSVLNYALIATGTVLLFREWGRSSGLRAKQAAMLTVAVFPAMVANLVSVTDVAFTPYDITPFGFVATGVIFAWALFRIHFLDVAPIARQTAMAEMDDAVVTLDTSDRIVDCNPAAAALLDVDDYLGTPAAPVFDEFTAGGFEAIEAAVDSEQAVTATVDGETRHYLVSTSPIEDGRRADVGAVVVMRDITPIKDRERALQSREQELDLFKQVLTRVLRHNLRNELAAISGNAEYITEKADDPDIAERARAIIEASDTLADTSEKARRIEQIMGDEEGRMDYDLRALAEEAVEDVARRYDEVSFSVSGLDTCRVRAVVGLDAAVTNLVENAAEHNDAADPQVTVSIEAQPGGISFTVADNGPGIPPQEIAVLERAEETPLEHGSGVGLWLVDWVLDEADADIEFETGDDGTTVSIKFDGDGPTDIGTVGPATEQVSPPSE